MTLQQMITIVNKSENVDSRKSSLLLTLPVFVSHSQ